uniref:Uncharacterized protein n=1 Tax=Manihot esculenta TaxID=3983 RepID=A0A2C9VHF9_MANES
MKNKGRKIKKVKTYPTMKTFWHVDNVTSKYMHL